MGERKHWSDADGYKRGYQTALDDVMGEFGTDGLAGMLSWVLRNTEKEDLRVAANEALRQTREAANHVPMRLTGVLTVLEGA